MLQRSLKRKRGNSTSPRRGRRGGTPLHRTRTVVTTKAYAADDQDEKNPRVGRVLVSVQQKDFDESDDEPDPNEGWFERCEKFIRKDMNQIYRDFSNVNDTLVQIQNESVDKFNDVPLHEETTSVANFIKKESENIDTLKISADAGNAEAQYTVGTFYRNGLGGASKNPKEAFRYFQMAANKKHADAMNAVGYLLMGGEGITKKEKDGFLFFLKASNAGSVYGSFNVALCYRKGTGTEKDLRKSFQYFKIAANKNMGQAQYELGIAYFLGEGIDKNKEEALRWLNRADSNKTDEKALFAIALIDQKKDTFDRYRNFIL